jgi:hypothetical protein
MYRVFLPVALGALLASSIAFGQTQANAPAAASGSMHAICRDGTPYSGATLKGACRGHGGIDRNASSKGAKAAAPAAPAAATPMTSSPSPVTGGGAGKVWVNTPTNVYHCPGDRYYGKTKNGTYMTEAEAKAKGARPDHGKACK